MSLDVILVNAIGLITIVTVVWYVLLSRSRREGGVVGDGVQGALVVVKGGYTPDTIILERGRPARIVFRREESALCSERVILPAFDRSAMLPEGEEVSVEFVPGARGEYPFVCQTGTLLGRIIVE